MEVTAKMKLYNVYRICKKYIDFNEIIEVASNEELNSAGTKKITVYSIKNWPNLKNVLIYISKIPALKPYVDDCIRAVPDTLQEDKIIRVNYDKYSVINNKQNILKSKMKNIVELYESLNIETGENGIDIKLPPCDDLKEYISYLKDLDFIFSQCPFLQYDNEVLKFDSVDVGSNWVKLTVATASTCFIISSVASILDKAISLRSHYISVQQQEELLKSQQIKNELAEEEINLFKKLKNAGMNTIIEKSEKEFKKSLTPEEKDKVKRTLDKLIILLDKGCEIYATLDAPEEVQALFPEIQENLELPDSIVNYIEDKTQSPE